MIWLSGSWLAKWPVVPGLGVMLTPNGGHGGGIGMGPGSVLDVMPWAGDTGMFAAPERFTMERYLDWLVRRRVHLATCLFATAPDAMGDWARTWELARPALPRIRELGYKVALVAQDGMTALPAPEEWDCLFIGGTTAFKLSEAAYRLAWDAKGLGKWTHMGRVNGEPRLRAAAQGGFDSADGTKLKFGPDTNLPLVLRWISRLATAPPLPLEW